MNTGISLLTKESPPPYGRLRDLILVAASGFVLLFTFFCLATGITTVFMHLYYFPIILLAHRYHVRGVLYSAVLSLLYLGMVVFFQFSQANELAGAFLRVLSFIGVAAVTAWLSMELDKKQQELRTISRFNDSIISNANVLLAVMDATGKILVWNDAAEAISGYRSGEVLGKNAIWKQLYPDADYRRKITSTLSPIISEKKFLENFETIIRAKNGDLKSISWNTRALSDEPGHPARFVAIGIDVTARRKAEDALKISELRFRRTFETAKDGLLLVDRDTWKILKVNPAFTDILGYPDEEISGKQFGELGLIKEAGDFQIAQQKLADYGFVFFPDVPLESRTGRHVDTEIYLVDRTMQVQVNVRDITGRKQAEKEMISKTEELRAAYEKLTAVEEELRSNYEELSRSQQALSQARRKLSLLNSVTFEDIRNAIFSLNGYLELGKDKTGDPAALGFFEKEKAIVRDIENSMSFAGNYQQMGINPPKWQNVNQVFLYAISHLPPLTLTRDIQLGTLEIYSDPLLEKVLFNIVENTLLYSPGATEFSASFREVPDGLLLLLQDNGAGIPAGEKENIFTREYAQRQGMGLFLAREILGITGITITETGEPGRGARFEILVPKEKYRFGDRG
jgi:PAS domain S-box-containing protein